MAEPVSDVAAPSAQRSTLKPHGDGASSGRADTADSLQSHDMPTMSSFQAVNTKAVMDKNTANAAGVGPSGGQTAKDDAVPSQADGSDGTYGTRSRNRTRINYAEDQDMDFEFSSAATTTKKKAANEVPPAGQGVEAKRAPDFAKLFTNSNGDAKDKESTAGSSGAPAAVSKKRKAAGPPQQSQTPPTVTASAQSAARKPTASASAPASSTMARETNVMTFTKHRSCLNKRGELIADDGAKLSVNDHVYLVSEPPGEPYYLCRIMEFLHVDSDNPNSPIDSMRVNWFYRPRDVQRFNSDTRLVYGTMHSDMCPLTSLRGKCTIKHRSEIEDLEIYRKERDSFYFVQVFDRFIRRWYECIPVSQIINVPENVKKALDERWKFVVVEIGRVKELTSAVKTCKRCAKYCASNDSVDCAICKNSYHMNCVQPPLPKKPSRGFAWACGPCSRASERKLEARNTPTVSGDVTEAEEEVLEEEEVPETSNDNTRAPSPTEDDMVIDTHPATQAEIALAKMWPMRYLGIHCRVEDALQYDDRAIYPRASSRLGPRHQANVNVWHGRPVELVKPADIRKRYAKGTGKKETKLTKETLAALEADREERAKRPKWVQDEPAGYIARGEDYDNDDPRCTAKLMFKMPPSDQLSEQDVDNTYVKRAKQQARLVGVPPFGINYLDKAMELLTANKYDMELSLKQLQKVDRVKDLHEPVLSKSELAKFEEGVAKYGSEHRLIRLHMKTNLPNSDIVRFYYLWKKTPKGREIWGNYGGRKGSKRKLENDAGARLQAEVANDGDDSAFDNDKAIKRNRGFQCKFCNTIHSRQWRRAPGVSAGQTAPADGKNANKDKKDRLLLALCLRCAGLWRKYAIQWEDIDEVARKVALGGGRAWKRRIDEELLRELVAANEAASTPAQEAQAAVQSIENGEPPKKKSKTDKDAVPMPPEPPKKKEKPAPPPKEPTPPPPPIVPAQPLWRDLPCAVCNVPEGTVACSHCKLTVHRACFGLSETEGVKTDGSVNWICEQCQNDRNPSVSTEYACCLCLTEETHVDLVEPPRVSHKKKTDREREKERLEKELADAMRADYRSKQLAMNRPPMPREPLKRTTGNNWVHVYCAVFTPEIRFSNAKALEVAEGFQNIPQARYETVCKLCKNKDHQNRVRENAGVCVSCFQCHQNFHASCAHEAGYIFGFDVTPVKGSRKDQITTVSLGEETGSVIAGVWCKEHTIKSVVHPVQEVADEETGKTALQVFVENYKQADLTLTGTVRKANLAQLTKDKGQNAAPSALNLARRESTANSIAAAVRRGARTSSVAETKSEEEGETTEIADVPEAPQERRCVKCKIDVTPRWHAVVKETSTKVPTPPRSPHRRMSITVGEYAEPERQQPTHSESGPVVDITGAPIPRPPPTETPRHLDGPAAPAVPNGHAWDSTADRFHSRPVMNGDHTPAPPASLPQQHSTAESHGEQRPALDGSSGQATEDVYHNHALPRYQNAASALTPPLAQAETTENATTQEYLCHKCFIKRKIDPTPSPPPRAAPIALSPPKSYPLQLDWSRPPAPPSQPAFEDPPRMPWDEPPRQSQPPAPPPPPPVNGLGPPLAYGQPPSVPPPPHSGYPPYGSQPNGYHAPSHPGPHVPHPPPHERHPSYGYPGQPPPNPPPYVPHTAPRPSPMPSFPPTGQPLPNGISSPHGGGHAPLPSPSYGAGLGQHHYAARRTESPFPPHQQLAPIGQPLHSSPQAPFARPEGTNGQPPPMLMQQPPPQSHTSPSIAQARPESQVGRPTTPREGQRNGTPGVGGASASPSLRNLLH